jgi:hypothetical protein
MSTRVDLQAAVADYVEGAAYSGAPLDVNNAAIHLASQHPQSGFPLNEICDMIRAAAKTRGVEVVSDRCA